jgi:hypothetical protein
MVLAELAYEDGSSGQGCSKFVSCAGSQGSKCDQMFISQHAFPSRCQHFFPLLKSGSHFVHEIGDQACAEKKGDVHTP